METLKQSLDESYVIRALLKHNYLPAHKLDLSELPPTFTSKDFGEKTAFELAESEGRGQNCGYDCISYLSTRFNNVPRTLSIPHPVAYSRLSLCIKENWESIKWICDNKNSFIHPRIHPDGRMFTMEYGNGPKQKLKNLRSAFGKRFAVHADVSNCYPSIYTHSFPWAAIGRNAAKNRRSPKEWFNLLDKHMRGVNRCETKGICIGPATSSIIAEFILGKVDEALRNEFAHLRFVDDFRAFCETEDEALRFIRRLSEELINFRLELNARKTLIHPLPCAHTQEWVQKLSLWAPKRETLTVYDITNYLDLALSMSEREPDGSVLKYALKTIRDKKMKDDALFALASFALNLSYHNPVLVPLLDKIFDRILKQGYKFVYNDSVLELIARFSEDRCSDGLSWALYYAKKHGVVISGDLARAIVNNRDCLTLAQLRRIGDDDAKRIISEFIQHLIGGIVDEVDKYELDQFWILLYDAFLDGEIDNPYQSETAFEILSKANVRFIKL